MNDVPSVSWRSELAWAKVLSSFSIAPQASFHKSVYDPTIRTYLHRDAAHKISLKTDLPELHPKLSPGCTEADLLQHCEGIPGVPAVRAFRETAAACVLSMNRIEGVSLQDLVGTLSPVQTCTIIVRLLQTTLAVSWRGIAHNDVVPRNIMIGPRSQPYLVDFDQAHHAGRVGALLRNVLGIKAGDRSIYGSWLLVAARLLFQFLPQRSARRMPALPPDASRAQRKLHRAWKVAQRVGLNAGGEPLARYALDVDGMTFPGARPWEERWTLLCSAADFRGLRTLELDCNIGLLSTWLLKEGHAASVLGVDANPSILAVAKQVADAFEAAASFEKVDLGAAYAWERRFEPTDFDVVFVLGVADATHDKQRLMRFLAGFPLVVFEGHGPDGLEIERFSDAGFTGHRVLGTSDTGRTVFVFSK